MIGTGQARANPLIVAPTNGADFATSSQSPGGFASLLQGLVEYSATPASAASASRLARHNAAPVTPAPSKNSGAKLAAMQAKPQNASNAVPAKSLHSAPSLVQRAAPLTASLTLVPQPATNLSPGHNEAGPETPARAMNTPSDAATPTPATVRPLPSTALLPAPTTSMLGTGRPLAGSPPQLAFALQLTWQRGGSGTEAEIHSGAETSARIALHAFAGLASSSDAATSKPTNPQVATPASGIMVSDPEDKEAARVSLQPPTRPRGSQGRVEPNLGLDSSQTELWNHDAKTMESPSAGARSSAHPLLSSSPNPHIVLPAQLASEFSTADSPKISLRAQTPDSLPDLDSAADAVPPQFAVGLAKAAAESHQVASSLGVRTGQMPRAPKFAAPDQRARAEQTDGSPSSREGTRGTAGATGQRTDESATKIAESGGAEQDAAGSEISAKGAPLLDQPAPPTNHDGPRSLAEGVLLAQTPEPGPVSIPSSKPGVAPSPAGSPDADIAAPRAQAPQPLREVSLRLAVGTSEASKGSVDVQLAERAGKVQVAVRTADQDLAKSLQGNLGDLVGRLEERGFKTEAWTPAIAQHSELTMREAAASSASQNHSGGSGAQDGQPDSRGQRQSGQRRQGRWESELERTNLKETFEAPG